MMMGSQMLDILRSGVWASLTGGWYHDPSHRIFTNTFHLYLWLSLFSLPLSFHLYFTTFVWYVWLIYASLIFLLFVVIKSVNQILHHMFDTSEVMEEQIPGDEDFGHPRSNLGPDTNQECIGLQDMTGAARSSSSRNSLAETGAGQERQERQERPVRRSRRLERPSSTFDLKVDVHPVSRAGDRQDTDVVIMVDEESPGERGHEVTRELVLGEAKQDRFYHRKAEAAEVSEVSEVSPDKPGLSQCEVSLGSVTTSSQLTVSCQRRPDDRRFSNLSNLARSLPSDSSSMLEPVTGSLDLAAILEPGFSQAGRQKERTTKVRRTKSALETGQTVSLDAGINSEVSKYKRNKSLETSEAPQSIREVAEEVSSREAELDMEVQANVEQRFKGSDVNLSTYQEQLEEATAALLIAGQYLERETNNKKYLTQSAEQDDSTTGEAEETDLRGSGPYLPMVGRVKSKETKEGRVGEVEDSPAAHNETGASLRSTVGLDWLFSDSEPDQPPGSPKLIAQPLRSRSESPRSVCPPAQLEPPREPRDSSHGSSGTDTETRALLNKLESVENILEQSGGAIPKRKPPSRRVRSGGQRSGSLDGGRRRREEDGRPRRRRPGLEVEEDYQMPSSNTLCDDAAGLILFLDILNGPDGQNKEAEAELKKLIEARRSRMQQEEGREGARPPSLLGEEESGCQDRRNRKRRTARRRRHNAQSNSDQLCEAESKAGEGDVRKRDKRSRSQRDNVPHIATDHDDTSTGAVHCFKDEFGNWQTYTFGGESLASSSVGQTEGRALASLLSRESRVETPTSSRSESADSSLTVVLDSPAMVFQPNSESRAVESQRDSQIETERNSREQQQQHWSRENSVLDYSRLYGAGHSANTVTGFRRNNPLQMFAESWLERTRQGMTDMAGNNPSTSLTSLSGPTAHINLGSVVSGSQAANIVSVPRVKKYHRLSLPGIKSGVKIFLDRVQLRNILDQDKNLMISVTAVLLSVLVSVLGSLVLQTGHFRDLCLVLFCGVQASCHYSLLKSVQPDASSPTHGDNSVTVFSRPVYFIISCLLFLCLDKAVDSELSGFSLYGHSSWFSSSDLNTCRDFVFAFILAFPLIFTIGLLPQVNTALMYLLETIDIHVFGGNASSSLQASFYCLIRSISAVVIMFGFAYGGLTEGGQGSSHSAYAQQVLFSIFCSLSVVISYHLSRCSSDPTVVLSLMKRHAIAILCEDAVGVNTSSSNSGAQSPLEEPVMPQDPLPKKLRDTVNARLKNDAIVCFVAAIAVFLILQSDVLDHLYPNLDLVVWSLAITTGFLLHYLLPHLRKQTPWKCFAAPILPPFEQSLFEVSGAAKVMWWEKCLLWASSIERSLLYPLIFLSAVSHDRQVFSSLFGTWAGSLVLTVSLTKCLRCVWSDSSKQYFTLLLCILLFQYNPPAGTFNIIISDTRSSPFVLDYFLTTILVHKLLELYLKCQFVITYIAPHNINWGSAFHAFAQPFSVPHSAMLFLQAIISSILSSPLNPFLGSTIFICSYVRPVKFWERNYNTKRTDHSNTRLASQFEMRNLGADDNNLNSIFYEHLTRSLQHSLAGDLMLGRWGSVQQGDCFVLASDYLNCLVHIIELGNGLCTFQVRGLEFRGTYCQQREVEAIQEGVEDDEGCCCCDPGHLPHMLSINAAFKQRWLAWEVSAVKYVLEGYSITDNSAQSMLQVWDLRKVLISYYIKSIIYYTVRSPKLMEWLQNESILAAIRSTCDKSFVDLDPIFNPNIDEDFDTRNSGITRNSYCYIYLGWIQHCCHARDPSIGNGKDSEVVSLCFALSLLGRRALGAQSNNSLSSVEFFLIGLHALFKGDFRITCTRDEWVFSDMELLRKVVAPAVRMSLKLHQDHFMSPEEYEENSVLYDAITSHEQNLVISHEGDPAWRHAVLSGAPSLLALRHVVDDGADDYKIIMLNKRHLSFRVIKLNRECVRGLWAGQQQELIFLRNRNPERGSIQNATQALRNIINSSCDQPIGYPIYVSPLTTSYTDSHPQVRGVVGGPLSLKMIQANLLHCWLELRERCIAACSSSSSADCEQAAPEPNSERPGSLAGNRCSVVSSVSKPSTGTLASLAGLLSSHSTSLEAAQAGQAGQVARRARTVSGGGEGGGSPLPGLTRANKKPQQVLGRIIDSEKVYDNMNLGRRIDPYWPDPDWRAKGGRNAWNSWIPLDNMEGPIVHRWVPCHRDPFNRSHTDKTILLLKIGERYVPIAEQAVLVLPEEDKLSHKSLTDNEKSGRSKKSSREEAGSEGTEVEEVWTRLERTAGSAIPAISEQEEAGGPGDDMLELRASSLDVEC